ncbi:MAG: phospho-N-acetylmuramoyl-pentapeptide-transferase, partial [Clostridia bacterium]|nr:phospho-N-acetylmuramoyl-pentapeptide-transferase [Clostridia bacterium]
MIDFLFYIQACVACFLLSIVISPMVISVIKREKMNQVILHYVESHKSKAGTPTMGGIIFIISIAISALIFFKGSSNLGLVCVLVFVCYGIVGFLDDFIKFKLKRNLGLRAYQKLLFQLIIAGGVAYFVYASPIIGSKLFIPFVNIEIDVGAWIIPIVIVVFLASTNSVNLTDGLDGLAASTVLCYMLSFVFLMLVMLNSRLLNITTIELFEYKNIIILCSCVIGAMMCFLLYNCFPAKIFMGDTGSLSLGSLVASVLIFSRCTLFIPVLGIMFVLSSVSVIIQVAYYKMTKKRVFLMAPLHHHFEKRGVFEGRIVMCYAIITSLVGLITVLL